MVVEIRIGSGNDGGSTNISALKKMYFSGKPIFMLLRRDGCPPCEDTKPEWLKISQSEEVKPLDIVVADIEEKSLKALDFMNPQVKFIGYPTMVHIQNKKIHPFEEGRDVNSFVNWIKSTFEKSGAKSRAKSTFKKSTFEKSGAKSRAKSTFKKGGAKSTFKNGGAKSTFKKGGAKRKTKRRRRVKR